MVSVTRQALFGAAAAAAMLASPAVHAEGIDWAGGYLGIHAGGQFTTGRMTLVPGGYDTVFGPGSKPEATMSPDGFAGGALAGYMARIGASTFVGVELDVTGSTAKDTQITSATVGWDASNRMKQEITGRARARFGYAVGKLMPFIAGGVSVSRVSMDLDIDCFGQHYSDHTAKTLTGFNVGAGVEYAMSRHLRARLEYIFDGYGSPQLATLKPDWNDRKFHNLRTSTVRVAVAYAF
ncbi:MAG: outer membrane beta-barrel protein [Alphaproteobacteria bacterium]|nr:outer membrane beta-barrel protein [Alphaproteobacteria bacterium]